jgi:hypothetical protein
MRKPAVVRKLSKAAPTIAVVAVFGLAVAGAGVAAGQQSLSAIDAPYTQNFDTLASTGTSNVLPAGWALNEVGTSTRNDGKYTAGTGSDTAGDTYSFGSTDSSERALGMLLSGTLIPMVGAFFVNDTGETISSLDVSYTGEQWRLGALGRGPDRLDFEYNLTATGLDTASGWVDVNALDFFSPVTTGTVGALDGNAVGNRSSVAGTIIGISIPPGHTFWIRWADFNVANADDGLAVDDVSLTAHAAQTLSIADTQVTEGDSGTTTASFTVSLSTPAPAGGVSFDIATSNGSAQAPEDYAATSVTGATIPQGVSNYSFVVSVKGDTTVEQDETFSVDISNITGAGPGDTHAVGTILNDDLPPPVAIHDIQGATHISPFVGQRPRVLGIVTARSTTGFWMQDPSPDADPATSEGIFVFTSSAPTVAVGDRVRVAGIVQEFRPGGSTGGNLTTTELSGAPAVTVLSSGNPLPDPIVIGNGGRIPPDAVIEDDAAGDVETGGVFDPAQDGIDFWESLEGMRVQLNDAVAVGPTNAFGETPIVGDDGANASMPTERGGLLLQPNDGNPERVIADELLVPLPAMNVGDHYDGPIVGVLDYNFGNFFVEVTSVVGAVHDGVTPETTTQVGPGELAVSTFNFENLDPTDPQAKFDRLAYEIVFNLRAPDLIAGEEVQDNSGPTDNGVVDASQTLAHLVATIQARGGPSYAWREIDPVDGRDGGEPGGNIRQVFLFRTDRGLSFVDRPGGTSTTATEVAGSGVSTQLTVSPGRIDPTNSAWNASRKALAGEFDFHGHHLFVIANHFNSKGGDEPLLGRFQPPTRSSEVQRHQQANLVAGFVSHLTAADPDANVIVLGDLNDFEFSETVQILEAAGLHDLMDTLPLNQRYSYEFEGNAQVLDHVLFSGPLFARSLVYDPVHVNAEFWNQASDHDPSVVRVQLNDAPSASAGGPYSVDEGSSVTLTASGSDPEGGALSYAWDLDNDGTFEAPGQSVSFSPDDGPSTPIVKVRATDDVGLASTAQATVTVANVAPTVTALTATPVNALVGQGVTFTGTATDPSAADTGAGFSWAFDTGDGFGAFGPNGFVSSFSACGTYTADAKARDKDGGVSAAFTSAPVHVYEGDVLPPLTTGAYNVVQRGQVVPVKITIGCNGFLGGLHPAISIRAGDYDPAVDPGDPSYVVPDTASSADTSGVMREGDQQYVYNLGVPSNGSAGQLYTVLIRPFGGSAPTLYAVLKIRR